MPFNWGEIGRVAGQVGSGILEQYARGARRGPLAPSGRLPPYASFGPGLAIPGPGDVEVYRPRRRRGITARDLSSFRRVANLIKRYSRPVRSFRTRPGRR